MRPYHSVLHRKKSILELRHSDQLFIGGTRDIYLTHVSRTLFLGSWAKEKEALVTTFLALLRQLQGTGYADFQPPFVGIGPIENKVANGYVTYGNLLNSSDRYPEESSKGQGTPRRY